MAEVIRKDMNRILVPEPIYQAMPPAVYASRIGFWKHVGVQEYLEVYRTANCVMGPRRAIRSARDLAIRTAIESNATHLLFLDDDVKTPPDILDQLLAVNKPIVGGLMHRDDGTPIVFRNSFPSGDEPWLNHPKTGAFECAAVGAGCMLIQAEVLHNIIEVDRWAFNYDETERSMDVRFCRKAENAGFSVWCWPDVPCEQIKHYA